MADLFDLTHSSDEEANNSSIDISGSLNNSITAGSPLNLNVWIPMEPCAKPSVRFGRGRGGFKSWQRCYKDNDVALKMNLFGDHIKTAMALIGFTLRPRNEPLAVVIWCFLRRPNHHFVNNDRVAGRLKDAMVEQLTEAVKPDNDNLAKFVLDAMSKIVYDDDSQVVQLLVLKLRDNDGQCLGRVAVKVSPVDNAMLPMPDF
jgi:Holliday junction resolvase RusA-like endonuclease